MQVKVDIITIGDEILIGQIVDTNSSWLASELNQKSFTINQMYSVGDDAFQIEQSLANSMQNADVVLLTGGLGVTNDDITKKVLCRFFDTDLVYDEAVMQNIKRLYHQRSQVLNEKTNTQAFVPRDCTIISNKKGTAPILWFERDEKVIVALPGVPHEMKFSVANDILPKLSERFETSAIIHKTVQVFGIPESKLAIQIEEWENNLPTYIRLAYLPSFRIVKLRLSGVSDDNVALELELNKQIANLQEILKEAIFSLEDLPMEHIVGRLLKEKKLTISTAESCTGGNVARQLTSIAGSSQYYKGSVVAYHNEIKTSVLNVDKEILNQVGAVSREVVEQMSVGGRNLFQTDICVSVSGIAGPAGGTDDKPIGLVWIGISDKKQTFTKQIQLGNRERSEIVERTTKIALYEVLSFVRKFY